ncbi:unnamed protein product, partial [Mesorhabditis spiculigera]
MPSLVQLLGLLIFGVFRADSEEVHCWEGFASCLGKGNKTFCVNPESLADYSYQKCAFKDCQDDTAPIMIHEKTTCIPMERLDQGGMLPGDWKFTVCPKGHMNCGVHEPICVEAFSPLSRTAPLHTYNDRTAECTVEGCPPGHHPCKHSAKGLKQICIPYWHIQSVGEDNQCRLVDPNKIPHLKPTEDCAGRKDTVACWAGDDYACLPFERLASISLDNDNKTICQFAQCPNDGEIPCAAECHKIEDVQGVKPDGECEYRSMRRGTIIMIVSCSIIGTITVIGLVALIVRAYLTRNQKTKTGDKTGSIASAKLEPGAEDEKQPFMPSKNEKANNIKPQV